MLRQLLKQFTPVIFIILVLILIFSGIVYAATWEYKYPIIISDTSNVTRTYTPVMLGFGGQNLINAGKISTSGNDTNMQVGTSSIKYMLSTTNCTAVIPNLPSGGKATTDLYTGYSPEQSAFAIITGYNGYITTANNTSLNIGNSGNYSWSGYFDPTSTGYLLSANCTEEVQGNGDGTITARAWNSATSTNTTFRPSSIGLLSQLSPRYAGENWIMVSDNIDTTWVSMNGTTPLRDLYNYTNHTTQSGLIDGITVYVRGTYVSASGATETPCWYINGVSYNGTTRTIAGSTYAQLYTVSPASGLRWTWSELDSAQLGAYLVNPGGAGFGASMYDIWYTVHHWQPAAIVTSAIYSAGSHIISKYITGGNLGLVIDGVDVNTPFAGNVTTTASSYVWNSGNIMPYCDYISVYKGATQTLLYQPNTMLSGTTLPDRATGDGSQDGTITWGANTGISITYGEMTSYASTTADSSDTGSWTMPDSEMPLSWYANSSLTGLPFYDTFLEVSTSTGQPIATLYFLAMLGFAFGVFMLIVLFTRSALLATVAFNIALFIGSSMSIVPGWLPFSILIVQIGIMYLYKQVAY